MGFPAGYTEQMLPNFLFITLSLLSFLRPYILTLLRFLGLSHILEPSIGWPEPEPESKPVSASIIQEMLPVMKFTNVECATGSNSPPEQCAVCLYEFRNQEEIRLLTNCRHIFHRACVDRWMDHDQITCPLCKAHFVPDELIEVFHDKVAAAAAAISAVPEFGGEFSVINSFFLEFPLR